jgi:hypothetical protein
MTAAMMHPSAGCPPDATDIFVDPELAALWLPPAPAEQQRQHEALLREGCREPLHVWPCAGRWVLLSGFHLFETLRLHRLPFRVVIQECADRDAARLFVITRQLLGQHLAPLEVRYLRGLLYRQEKRGGTRKSRGRSVGGGGSTARALAKHFHVKAATVRRDGELAAAVTTLVEQGGADRSLLLGWQAGLNWQTVVELSRLEPARQRWALDHLKDKGCLPPRWRMAGESRTVTLPRELAARAAAVVRREGPERAKELARLLVTAAACSNGESEAAKRPEVR